MNFKSLSDIYRYMGLALMFIAAFLPTGMELTAICGLAMIGCSVLAKGKRPRCNQHRKRNTKKVYYTESIAYGGFKCKR